MTPAARSAAPAHTTADVVVVGTGFSGLGMAIALQRAGRDDFVIVEKADDVGGTWRDNTYPGCACDIPAHLYSFSYEQNPTWTRSYSAQPEIWDYLRRVAAKYDLVRRTQFGVELASARWDEDEQRWQARATNGNTYTSRVLIAGIGALHIPNIPALPGREEFKGVAFHSAQWRHDVDLAGKRVAVVGTGASAVQFVPRVAEQAAELTVFQRSAPWVMARPDHPLPERLRSAFAKAPPLQRIYRDAIYWLLELRAIGFNGHPGLLRPAERMVTNYITKTVDDPAVRAGLIPDYRLGCKRVLMSNDYYGTFNRDNVQLVTGGVRRLTATGVVGGDGAERTVDVVIYGTGFHVTDSFQYLDITGRDGVSLAEQFDRDGVESYLGINVVNFPNLFFLLGPNTGLGHNSVVFMIEQQAAYVVRLLEQMGRRGASTVEVAAPAQEAFNRRVQDKLRNGIWSTGGCTSWYLDSRGANRSLWPGFTFRYWWETLRVKPAAYLWG
ncbi:MAG: flavin-containing monooxygenase [Nocardioidaceae bacterium]